MYLLIKCAIKMRDMYGNHVREMKRLKYYTKLHKKDAHWVELIIIIRVWGYWILSSSYARPYHAFLSAPFSSFLTIYLSIYLNFRKHIFNFIIHFNMVPTFFEIFDSDRAPSENFKFSKKNHDFL